jgi:hypothetical protein
VFSAEAGIQYFQDVFRILDTRFRGYDDFFEAVRDSRYGTGNRPDLLIASAGR